ncbi:hypothetical protein [Geotalea toluenoxydans]
MFAVEMGHACGTHGELRIVMLGVGQTATEKKTFRNFPLAVSESAETGQKLGAVFPVIKYVAAAIPFIPAVGEMGVVWFVAVFVTEQVHNRVKFELCQQPIFFTQQQVAFQVEQPPPVASEEIKAVQVVRKIKMSGSIYENDSNYCNHGSSHQLYLFYPGEKRRK